MIVTTTVTADYFQNYIPLFLYCLQRAYPGTKAMIFVRGEVAGVVRDALELFDHNTTVFPHTFEKFPHLKSTTNCLRFLVPISKECIFTDVDLMWFKCKHYDVFEWHKKGAREAGTCWYGHGGPLKRPWRQGVHGDGGWTGDFRRISAGFFYVTDEWFRRTVEYYTTMRGQLRTGEWGTFREADEVMLCRLVRSIGDKPPEGRFCPPEIRGIHFGDGKKGFEHRITNYSTMKAKICDEVVIKWLRLQRDPVWIKLLAMVKTPEISYVYANMQSHITERLRRMKMQPNYRELMEELHGP